MSSIVARTAPARTNGSLRSCAAKYSGSAVINARPRAVWSTPCHCTAKSFLDIELRVASASVSVMIGATTRFEASVA